MEPILVSSLLTAGALALMWVVAKLIRIVPEQNAWIVETFGKYSRTLGPGLHLLIPGVQRIAYKHTLKEEVIDVAPQICITKDNVQVTVDGVLYLKVVDPNLSSYGIDNYRFATEQLAQTTMRAEIGKLELDKTFSERDYLNEAIVKSVDEASDPWGIKVTRYEIKDINPSNQIRQAMEQQVRAEREKRAEILLSEGQKESQINVSKAVRDESINNSKGDRQKRINEAEGRAESISILAKASADGIKMIAHAIQSSGGRKAAKMRLAEQYLNQLQEIYQNSTIEVLPADVAALKATIGSVLEGTNNAR